MVGAGCGWQPFFDALAAVMAHPEEWGGHDGDALEAEWVDCLWRLHNSIHHQLESLTS